MEKLKKRQYALIINRDDVLFTKPLKSFLENNPDTFLAIYYTDFFPPQADKWKYLITSYRIAELPYILLFIWRSLKAWLLGLPFTPQNLRSNYSIIALAKKQNIPCCHVKNVNSPSFYESLKAHNIDTVFSMTSQIYKKKILSSDNLEFYNIHPSLLPNNKGRFPIFWAILKDDDHGISCHRISRKIDEGEIIYQRILDVKNRKMVEEIMEQLSFEIPAFIGQAIEVLNGERAFSSLKKQASFYGPIPSKEDIRKYKIKIKE